MAPRTRKARLAAVMPRAAVKPSSMERITMRLWSPWLYVARPSRSLCRFWSDTKPAMKVGRSGPLVTDLNLIDLIRDTMPAPPPVLLDYLRTELTRLVSPRPSPYPLSRHPGFRPSFRCRDWLNTQLQAVKQVDLGFHTMAGKVLPLPPAAIRRRIGSDPTKKMVLIYGHFDVQSASKADGWSTKAFMLTVSDRRLDGYSRGSDDKGRVLRWVSVLQWNSERQTPPPVIALSGGKWNRGGCMSCWNGRGAGGYRFYRVFGRNPRTHNMGRPREQHPPWTAPPTWMKGEERSTNSSTTAWRTWRAQRGARLILR
ncbi:CNDP dipeptidase [Mycena venus]|uniref:CNDP dipeptidase n=1 Tax=Mycena venus TaxID=2733690 RepID=A0A8H7D708_9AGAR|nr:CNDP dipeptidase [Mycena venus]